LGDGVGFVGTTALGDGVARGGATWAGADLTGTGGGVGIGCGRCGIGASGGGTVEAFSGTTTPSCRGPGGAATISTRYTGGSGAAARVVRSTSPVIAAACNRTDAPTQGPSDTPPRRIVLVAT
jgi:hypothetical protein